jgi:SAM-dependent methyltransferase
MRTCVVCGEPGIRPHLRVSGAAGPEGLVPTTDRYGTALGDISRCPRCGHMQLEPMPSASRLEPALADAYSEDLLVEAAGQRADARRLLGRVREWGFTATDRPPRLLDLGCWLGLLLAEARGQGWEVTGVEPSDRAAAYAREEVELDVRTSRVLEAELPPRAYDVVVMHDVIEHLPDPRAALRRISGWAAPGGLLSLALPDAGSLLARRLGRRWWSILPTHLQYFTRGSLLSALRAEGFVPLEVTTAPKTFTVEYYLGRLHGYSPWLAARAIAAARRLGAAERLVAPDFRDRMSVLARVPER